ncbi:MAG: hypothetical protein QW165_05435 [Candidatus Woesearchaeota archaeon]
MRLWLVALLLLVPFSFALIIENTGRAGENPVIYGDTIVYERAGVIYAYDIAKRYEKELSRGSNPSIFGFIAAFETRETDVDLNGDGDYDDVVIRFANVRDGKVASTNSIGHNPFVWSKLIVFSTNEAELGVDFSNDGDMADDIIRQYDIDKKETVNLKAVGDFPVVNQHALLFVTDESQVSTDLNLDGDKSDNVLRVLDRESRKVSNEKISAGRIVLTKTGKAVFSSDGEIVFFDAIEQKNERTGQNGISPSLFDNVIVFERDGELYGYSLRNRNLAKLNLRGKSPSLFENRLAFVTSESDVGDLNNNGDTNDVIVRFAKEEDIDGDDVFDFSDNCQGVINEGQEDFNNNGIGDACDNEKPKQEEKKSESPPSAVQNAGETPAESAGIPWYWYVVGILLLPFVLYFSVKYGYRYYKKRKKSFGF